MISILKSAALNTRAVEMMRRAVGGLVAYDAFLRLWDAAFYLSDLGVLPRSLYYSFYEQSWAWSLYQLSGYPEFCVFLLTITIALGVLHLAGRSSRITRVLLWILVLSVQNRNPAILDGADDLTRLLLFWDMFFPEPGEKPERIVTWATLGFQFQLSLALLLWAQALGQDEMSFAVQWGRRELSLDIVFLTRFVQGALAFLALSVWVRVLRLAGLLLVLPALLILAFQLHPLFPVVVAAAALSLLPMTRKENELPEVRISLSPLKIVPLILISIIVLALNFAQNPSVRRMVVPLSQGVGLLQDWSRVYPLGQTRTVELVARYSGNPVWTVGGQSSRRDRLFAQRVGESPSWAAYLAGAVGHRYDLPGGVEVWMQKETLLHDFRLGGIEILLLTPTPVNSETHRLVTP